MHHIKESALQNNWHHKLCARVHATDEHATPNMDERPPRPQATRPKRQGPETAARRTDTSIQEVEERRDDRTPSLEPTQVLRGEPRRNRQGVDTQRIHEPTGSLESIHPRRGEAPAPALPADGPRDTTSAAAESTWSMLNLKVELS